MSINYCKALREAIYEEKLNLEMADFCNHEAFSKSDYENVVSMLTLNVFEEFEKDGKTVQDISAYLMRYVEKNGSLKNALAYEEGYLLINAAASRVAKEILIQAAEVPEVLLKKMIESDKESAERRIEEAGLIEAYCDYAGITPEQLLAKKERMIC